MAEHILQSKQKILEQNQKDLQEAKNTNMKNSMLDRLSLDEKRIQSMAQSIQQIAMLPDPLGQILKGWQQDNGLKIQRVSVPIGVIGIIYESRPNVTSDSASLCFKSGNVCILKGGKEAKHSNNIIASLLQEVLIQNNLPKECINLLENTSREGVLEFIKQDQYIDLLIPRGGEGLISFVSANATIPVLKHDKGVCHLYLHSDAQEEIAINIAINAKTQRPSACNSIETLLIHQDLAPQILIRLAHSLNHTQTTLKLDKQAKQILDSQNGLYDLQWEELDDQDFHNEYGEKILNIAIVKDLQEAIKHINTYGSKHSESIITQNLQVAEEFLSLVDASSVYVNASTRFSDGGEFGFGAEIGISTNKLHARGPVGLEGLTTYKYKIYGGGQIR